MAATTPEISKAWRHYLVMLLFAVAAVLLLMRLVDLQVMQNEFLAGEGAARQLRVIESSAVRGGIFDRNGEPLALSTPVDSVWAEPSLALQQRELIPQLAHLLKRDAHELTEFLQHRLDREFVWLKRQVKPELAEAVAALDLSGVHLRREYQRYYPNAEVTAQVLGYTGIDDQGQEGLELSFNDWLAATPGKRRVIRNRKGQVVEDFEQIKPPEPGQDLTISLDLRLQYIAYRALKRAMHQHQARAASAVLLDSRTGEVLAMVNQPSFNPNTKQDRASSKSRNRALTDLFEPGSTIKPITLLEALESGRYEETTVLNTAPGSIRVSGHTIRDHRNYGTLDLNGILRKSSNVGATKIALDLEPEALWENLKAFGLGSRTGMSFPGEASGYVRHFSQWRELDQASVSYGYGFAVTTAQLARAYSVFANGGSLPELSLLKLDRAPRLQAVVDTKLAHRLLLMLEQTISAEGTGWRAAVQGYRVAGKTGTVRKLGAEGYSEDRSAALFAGLAPVSAPRLVLAVMVDEPQGENVGGGSVAAPVFAEIMNNALRVLNISPDHWLPAQQQPEAQPKRNS